MFNSSDLREGFRAMTVVQFLVLAFYTVLVILVTRWYTINHYPPPKIRNIIRPDAQMLMQTTRPFIEHCETCPLFKQEKEEDDAN